MGITLVLDGTVEMSFKSIYVHLLSRFSEQAYIRKRTERCLLRIQLPDDIATTLYYIMHDDRSSWINRSFPSVVR